MTSACLYGSYVRRQKPKLLARQEWYHKSERKNKIRKYKKFTNFLNLNELLEQFSINNVVVPKFPITTDMHHVTEL